MRAITNWFRPGLPPGWNHSFFRIVLPSGQFGFVASDALLPLPGDLLCYAKDGNAWRIAGFFGGMPPAK